MIDPHVHLRDWNQSSKETIEHGLAVARKAGITRVFDMPNTNPVCTDKESILDRLALGTEIARKHRMGYHLYAGLTSDLKQVEDMVMVHGSLFPLVCGLKMFLANSTGNMGLVTEELQRNVIRTLSKCNYQGVLAVHAEMEDLNDSSKYDPSDFATHSNARPSISEIESVKRIIRICNEEKFPGHLHICHVSTKGAIEEVMKAKESGMRISMGATAHHALYNTEDAHDNSRGLKMNPPLRPEEDRREVFNALLDGRIDWVESDHAPHTIEDKVKGASGIPGFSGTLMLLDALRKAGCSEEHLEDLFGKAVLRTFGLRDEEVFIPKDPKSRFRKIENEYPFKPFVWE